MKELSTVDHFKNSSMGHRVTVEQARETLGDEATGMSDDEIQELIDDLSVMAKWALKEAARINDSRTPLHSSRSKNNSTEV